jgi:hypothetical protein
MGKLVDEIALALAHTSDGVSVSTYAAIAMAVKNEALRRINKERVGGSTAWGIIEELKSLGITPTDDDAAIINSVVAHNLSDSRHDVRARQYGKR